MKRVNKPRINTHKSNDLLSLVKIIFFDFDGVFTDNMVHTFQNGKELIRCCRSDGLGIARLSEVDVKSYIISTETNPVVSVRAKKLRVQCKQGVKDKAKVILKICNELSVDPKLAAFVGNDINDIAALSVVGYPIVVADAYPEVMPYAFFISEKPGGYGAVREISDLIYWSKINNNN